jgi:hypothetical protein
VGDFAHSAAQEPELTCEEVSHEADGPRRRIAADRCPTPRLPSPDRLPAHSFVARAVTGVGLAAARNSGGLVSNLVFDDAEQVIPVRDLD